MSYDPLTTTPPEARMKYVLNGSEPYNPLKRVGIPALVGLAVGWLLASGAFGNGTAATITPPACTAPAATTTPGR